VALAIFAILATTIFGSYNMVFSSAEPIQSGISDFEMAQNCINRMRIDLRSLHVALPPAYKKPDINDEPDHYRVMGDTTYSGGKSFSRLRFCSLAHVSFEQTVRDGIGQIVFYVQEIGESRYVLRRADTLYPYPEVEENATDPVLCERIKSLKFTYYDKEGDSHENWDSDSEQFENATPRSIGIEIEIGDESSSRRFETVVALPVWRDKPGEL
jgi:general secretion pathway protein J